MDRELRTKWMFWELYRGIEQYPVSSTGQGTYRFSA